MRQPGRRVALKESFDPAQLRSFQSECAVLSRLQHDHLPCYYEVFAAGGNGYLVKAAFGMTWLGMGDAVCVLRLEGGPSE